MRNTPGTVREHTTPTLQNASHHKKIEKISPKQTVIFNEVSFLFNIDTVHL